MFRRTLTAVAAVGLLTTMATAPAFSRTVGKQIGSNYTLTHNPHDRTVGMSQGRRYAPDSIKLGDAKPSAQGGKDHKNWVNVEPIYRGSTKPSGSGSRTGTGCTAPCNGGNGGILFGNGGDGASRPVSGGRGGMLSGNGGQGGAGSTIGWKYSNFKIKMDR
jgi:hypothetical protein